MTNGSFGRIFLTISMGLMEGQRLRRLFSIDKVSDDYIDIAEKDFSFFRF